MSPLLSILRKERGTWAATLHDPVPQPLIKVRMAHLRGVQAALTSSALERLVGVELSVLIEASRGAQTGYLEGYSDTDVRCFVDAPNSLHNRLVRVCVTKALGDHVLAYPITA